MLLVSPYVCAKALNLNPLIQLVLLLVVLWPLAAVNAKRWHDLDKSAWWIAIGIIPIIGSIVSLAYTGFLAGTPGPNRFGPDSGTRPLDRRSILLVTIAILLGIAIILFSIDLFLKYTYQR